MMKRKYIPFQCDLLKVEESILTTYSKIHVVDGDNNN